MKAAQKYTKKSNIENFTKISNAEALCWWQWCLQELWFGPKLLPWAHLSDVSVGCNWERWTYCMVALRPTWLPGVAGGPREADIRTLSLYLDHGLVCPQECRKALPSCSASEKLYKHGLDPRQTHRRHEDRNILLQIEAAHMQPERKRETQHRAEVGECWKGKALNNY